jgi:D-beta-D-heptose 7-phosphate kinase/D-beta-D-heptose 1-phosphate adenosyltransferase
MSGLKMTKKRFRELAAGFSQKTIFVLGDLILDEWIWGKVNRISPEAPVPVVQAEKRTYTPGGASNVAANLLSLGAKTVVSGIVGQDDPGKILKKKLREQGADLRGILSLKGRHTSLKTRIIAHSQQVVRTDWETTDKLNEPHRRKLMSQASRLIETCDILLFSDYNKGIFNSVPIQEWMQSEQQKGKIIASGPKPANLSLFSGSSFLVLNHREAEQAVQHRIRDESDLKAAGKSLRSKYKIKALLITQGENGMTLFESDEKMTSIPAIATQVYDVSGAGDTVLAAGTLALSSGASFHEAAFLANLAAAVVVRKIGTATASLEEMENLF